MAEPALLFVQTSDLKVFVTPKGTVGLQLGKPAPELGFAPHLTFAAELTPAEARALSLALERTAAFAEGGSSQ